MPSEDKCALPCASGMPPKKKLKSTDTAESKEGGDQQSTTPADVDEEACADERKVVGSEGTLVLDGAVGRADEPSGPRELEEDAPVDSRPKVTQPIAFLAPDTTLNVMQTSVGGILTTLTEGGLQYLFAGARANIGIKSGRYMFEARIVESTGAVDVVGTQARMPTPRSFLRIGFSTPGTMPIIGDSEESICFDSEGSLMFNRKRSAVSRKFGSGDTVAVLLNLDEKSSNSSTISMFKDGARIAEPQALPESLKGKTLFPTVTFKNMTVHVNFGPQPHVPLPFRCLMIQEAAQADSAVTAYAPPKDGRHEVLFPVLLPDEGTFDWLDWFLEKNPQYAELSSRKVLEWAVRSGLFRSKANSLKNSIDKPDMNFGVPHLDDGSVKRVLAAVAPMQRRDLVVMEVQGNLCKEERMERMNDFSLPQFRKVAAVMVGEPSSGFKRRVRELLLKEKQERAEKDFKERKQERARKRMIELRQRQNERARRRTLRIKRRMERERQRRLEAERSADPGPGAEAAEGEGSEEEEEEAGR
mmetsp:Transcript_1783/g.5467  ORF Transcript_1783/g.5467 Transcript_1783/m.5467 type:complete len:529 (+) Transcript_1783:23-1609(+)